ncbi:cysteine--tRNA ligase [Algisphaera agarilytica]|uniref:Cysteine--tRNA ligase n=1 Tax=Algisphaera agarilytica TaxID=1385975 RepID=A0A7X0HAP1_9BACT|nr:cysteine--tRNA ligase [Algisphaera agarilytica]MBB6430915.1 cysteinyl-tRNA synthetase [Algisphaera agarilytica]
MPDLRFYNTLTHQIEPFTPLEADRVSMYNCGPTVYDFAHIGNFKTFLFADVLRRFLELVGYDVHQVMNLTDVGHMTEDQLADGGGEDKMEVAAQRLAEAKKAGDAHASAIDNPNDPYQVAEFYIDAFIEDAQLLGMKIADEFPQNMPRATDFVPNMVSMVEQLVAKDHAYVAADGAVYYSVESFESYGILSGNSIHELKGGAGGRVVAENQAGKRHPADFLLWKPDDTHLMKWNSPYGTGYPGWHIECSAMARAVLKRDVIDIHTGGEDNIFPHHECEIAQSRGATGEEEFARFWMHSRHLMVEGTKMSKSKGNFFTVRQILDGRFTDRPVDPAVLRYEMIKANYRSQMNFTKRGLEDSAANVRKLREYAAALEAQAGEPADVGIAHPAVARFVDALADDLNIAGALASVFEYINENPAAGMSAEASAESLGVIRCFDQVLGVLPVADAAGDDEAWASEKAAALDAARADKDYAAADAIRGELQDAGYDVKTTKEGTVATKRLA